MFLSSLAVGIVVAVVSLLGLIMRKIYMCIYIYI